MNYIFGKDCIVPRRSAWREDCKTGHAKNFLITSENKLVIRMNSGP